MTDAKTNKRGQKYQKTQKLVLKGLAVSPDKPNRPRFLLLNILKDGKYDKSASILQKSIPSCGIQPFKIHKESDGVVGEFWVVPPKNKQRAAHWQKIYESARSKEVTVEVALHNYCIQEDEVVKNGVYLELLEIKTE